MQRDDAKHSHIDSGGNLVHGAWFLDLDLFHKNHARARDSGGWHHVDIGGQPLYGARFKYVEPFYNGQARVEGFDGSLLVIDESGETPGPAQKPSQVASGRTLRRHGRPVEDPGDTGIRGIGQCSSCYRRLRKTSRTAFGLSREVGPRLMRALTELGLTRRGPDGTYQPTEKGSYLPEVASALPGGRGAVLGAVRPMPPGPTLPSPYGRANPASKTSTGKDFFDWLQDKPDQLEACHRVFGAYAKHDYQSLAGSVRLRGPRPHP